MGQGNQALLMLSFCPSPGVASVSKGLARSQGWYQGLGPLATP